MNPDFSSRRPTTGATGALQEGSGWSAVDGNTELRAFGFDETCPVQPSPRDWVQGVQDLWVGCGALQCLRNLQFGEVEHC